MKCRFGSFPGMALASAAAIGVATLAPPAFAGEGHSDALLLLDPDGNFVTGTLTGAGESTVIEAPVQVFEGEFTGPTTGSFYTNAYETDDPGFNSISGGAGYPAGYSTLPGNTEISFDVPAFSSGGLTANLWHWSGSGPVNFTPVATDVRLDIVFGLTGLATLDGSANDVSGFAIGITDPDGKLHQHLNFVLYETDDDVPADGFYLWSMRFRYPDGLGGTVESWDTYFVHGAGAHSEEAHEAAVAWLETSVVPEPASLALLGAGGLLMLTRRRRQVN